MSHRRAALPINVQPTVLNSLINPGLIAITLAALVGSLCLLSGLILLCFVSQTLHSPFSEGVLLVGIGLFISTIACVTWRLTSRRELSQVIEAIKAEVV